MVRMPGNEAPSCIIFMTSANDYVEGDKGQTCRVRDAIPRSTPMPKLTMGAEAGAEAGAASAVAAAAGAVVAGMGTVGAGTAGVDVGSVALAAPTRPPLRSLEFWRARRCHGEAAAPALAGARPAATSSASSTALSTFSLSCGGQQHVTWASAP